MDGPSLDSTKLDVAVDENNQNHNQTIQNGTDDGGNQTQTPNPGIESGLSKYFDPSSRLNRLVDRMGTVDAEDEAAKHMATGTHDKGGGRVFTITKRKNKNKDKNTKQLTTRHAAGFVS